MQRWYIAIDLKSFYASVECVERGLDPLTARLVVADASRTSKTICLAVTPALKALGCSGRPRLFEVEALVRRIRATQPGTPVDYIVAPPRMALYLAYSSRIYNIYLRHIAPEDIHVYSIDEVFIDATAYLKFARTDAHGLAMRMIRDVLADTGITATAGIGTNMYLAKVAMDIVAKRMPPDADGVRIAELDELSYRHKLWHHKPLTDFWRVGSGTQRRLAAYGIETMGDIARCSLSSEELLYRLFGVNAQLLIDHAWGWEPVTMAEVKAYRPEVRSLSCGQVLTEPYTTTRARIVLQEMAENIALNLIDKHMAAAGITLHIGYNCENIRRPEIRTTYSGPVDMDHYGRMVPRHSRGSMRFPSHTSSVRALKQAVARLFDEKVRPGLLIRRLCVTAGELVDETAADAELRRPIQPDLFAEHDADAERRRRQIREIERERTLHRTVLDIKKRFGRNSILKGLNYADGATQRTRNTQIGGHHA